MSYQVLARQWRPKTFSEVVGQQHVLEALTNALTHQRLHHAYLLSGTRGVGKTTIARILARSLNCEQGVSASPCGQCNTCLQINEGRFVDLLEIDAASRTKVEDTREILDNVQYRPSQGRYKVYLIDEVHMLSRHSFNALLKTLEEPPEHAIFLLATTDPDKLPVTVLSRCLQFQLRALTREEISEQLEKILVAESIQFEPPALQLLAKAARGSMRDALSLTDQAIAQGNQQVSEQVVASMLGSLNPRENLRILSVLVNGDVSASLQQLRSLASRMTDVAELLTELQSSLHQLALIQIAPDFVDSGLVEHHTELKALADVMPAEQIQVWYRLVLEGRKELPYAVDAFSAVEMTLLRLLAFRLGNASVDVPEVPTLRASKPEPSVHPDSIAQPAPTEEPKPQPVSQSQPTANVDDDLQSLLAMRDELFKGDETPEVKPDPKPELQAMPVEIESQQAAEEAPSFQVEKQHKELSPAVRSAADVDDWSAVLAGLNVVGLTRQLLLHTHMEREGDGYCLVIDAPQQAMFSEEMGAQIKEALRALIHDAPLEFRFSDLTDTPFQIQQKINEYQLSVATQRIQENAGVQRLQTALGAHIVEGSIQRQH
ncbi:MAG: DNA polymerase III gamma and tau subunits DnaX [Idiomarinaceae bacterium HL-53]|nr:MAG: DNA polymerase III gamma and tau subunits DnaX [Idiomarinaceae bacterium HL-53]CUS49452.1 DNA polymerase-3 subunit gamma/tau [Idiomarinaceae bacterium HL-53]